MPTSNKAVSDLAQLSAPQMRVVHCIRNWIQSGSLCHGDGVPSERVLAQDLKVTRGTVRRALEKLEQDGVLTLGRGGRRVVVAPAPVNSGLLADTIAVLTYFSDSTQLNHRQDGWLDYIGHGALEAIRSSRLHGLALEPSRLAKRGVRELVAGQPRGVVLADSVVRSELAYLAARTLHENNVPLVVFGNSEQNSIFDRVESDHDAGAYKLTRWLLDNGCKRILEVWPTVEPTQYWLHHRHLGYTRAMQESGIKPLEPLQIPAPPMQNNFFNDVRHMVGYLAEHITGRDAADALMVHTDGDFHAIAAACRLCAREPQSSIAIVGYDNYWAEAPPRAEESSIPLATIDKKNDQMGRELVHLLIERIKGQLPAQAQCRLVEPHLVVIDKGGEI